MAQEVAASPAPSETPIPTLIPTETETETFLPTVAPTPLPTETATETAVLTETATEQPTVMLTPSATELSTDSGQPTESASPSATNTQTAETATVSPTTTQTDSTGTPTETATASATQPAFTPEPPLTLLFTDTFDTGSLILWNIGTGWSLTSHDSGQAIQAVNSDEPVTFIHNTLNNAVVETHFAMSAGMVRLSLRQSEAGAYSAILAMNGQLALYRGDQVIGTAVVSPITTGTWHTLRLSAINHIIRAAVDSEETIVAEDVNPLPAGTLSFAGIGNENSSLLIDDVSLLLPTSEVSASVTPTLTVTPTGTNTPIPDYPLLFNDNFDDRMALRWHIGAASFIVRQPPDYAIRSYGDAGNIPAFDHDLSNVVAEARFKVLRGVAQIQIRVSDVGSYRAVLHDTGQIDLFKGDFLIQSVATTPSNDWRRLRIGAIDNTVHIWSDSAEIITWTDNNPLPEGHLVFGGIPLQSFLLMDDVFVWGEESTQMTAFSLNSLAPQSLGSSAPAPGAFSNQLVFRLVSHSGYEDGLYLADSDGNNLHLLLPGIFVNPVISPDGTKVAFGYGGDIYTIKTNGTQQFNVTNSPNDSEYEPSWSPDGTQIVFASLSYTTNFYEIIRQSVDGSNRQILVSDENLDYSNPKWSPVDNLIAFTTYNLTSSQSSVNIIPLSNPSNISTISSDGYASDWAHNSNKLAYSQYLIVCGSQFCNGAFSTHTVHADGTNDYDTGVYTSYHPIWSKLDDRLVLSYSANITPGASYSYYTMNPNGSDLSPLSGFPFWDGLSDWENVVVEPIVPTCDLSVDLGDVSDQQSGTNTGGLNWAINEANADPNPTTLCLAENSTYTLTTGYGDFFGNTGIPPITTDVTIEGNGAIIKRDSNLSAHFRILGVADTGDLKLHNVTIRNGLLDENAGAGMVIVGGNATLNGTIFAFNRATDSEAQGGAIYNYFGNLTITNSTLTQNTAALSAGSIYSWSGLEKLTTVTDSCIANNSAPDGISVGNSVSDSVNIQAQNNWWGTENGPTHISNTRPDPKGDGISDLVNYEPILTQSNCAIVVIDTPPLDPTDIVGRIAYVSTDSQNLTDVYTLYVTTGNSVRQTTAFNSGIVNNAPALSLDGQTLAYVQHDTGANTSGILIKPVRNTASDPDGIPIPLSSDTQLEDYPTWSPDGTRIAFFAQQGPSSDSNPGIWVINREGTGLQRVSYDTNARDLAWSPTSTQLLYVISDSSTGKDEIYLRDIDNANVQPRQLTNYPNSEDRQPVWSPDGTEFAFASNRQGKFDIFVQSIDNSQLTAVNITNSSWEDDLAPAWSPDGNQIALTSYYPSYQENPSNYGSNVQFILNIYERQNTGNAQRQAIAASVSSIGGWQLKFSQLLLLQALDSWLRWVNFIIQVEPTPTPTPSVCKVTIITSDTFQGYETNTPDQLQELKDMRVLSVDDDGDVIGVNILSAPIINAMNATPVLAPLMWGNVLQYDVNSRVEFAQGSNDKQIWYQIGPPGDTWIPVRYHGLDYSTTYDPCSTVDAPATLTFNYNRKAAANYAIEHSYDTAVYHNFLQNTEHRVTQALTRTLPLPYAYFRYFGLGDIYVDAEGKQKRATGSATFISESQWVGGMPMTLGNSGSCTTGVLLDWRYCFDHPGTLPMGTSSNPWDTHGDLHTYWTGSSSVLPAAFKGGLFITGGWDSSVIVGRATKKNDGSDGKPRTRQTDLNPEDKPELINLGAGDVYDQPALSARVVSLLNQNQNNQQPPQPLKMGDYITMRVPANSDWTQHPISTPFHGLMVIGWQEALDCKEAIFQGSDYKNDFRIWTVDQFAETYIPGNPTKALNDTPIANPVPWVVDFTAPPVYGNDSTIVETQNPVPRPFYCTMYFDFQQGLATNQMAGVDRFDAHDWQFFTLPNKVELSPNQLYVDAAWGW